MTPLKSYLLRAVRDWAVDNGFTPHIIVDAAGAGVAVPARYIENGRIVLNIHPRSIQHFELDDASLRFSARFAGQRFAVEAPMAAVLAVYAKENGQGISFPPETGAPEGSEPGPPGGEPPPKRPTLKVVK